MEERKAQLLRATDAGHAVGQRTGGMAEIVSAQVGEFLPFDVAPDALNRIEFGGVARQPLNGEPSTLALQIVTRFSSM